jgi:segregation and condensation protein A
VLGAAIGRLLTMPPEISVRHVLVPRVAVSERLAVLRDLLRRGSFSFDEAVRGADRMTVAVTLFALLELYKRGEADWEQGESFGEIDVRRPSGNAVGGVSLAAAGGANSVSGVGATRLAG